MINQRKYAARAAAWLGFALAAVTQPAGATGAFHPPVETATEICAKAALALHPGRIVRTTVLHGAKTIRIEIHIKQSDGKGWLVLCDGTSGKIISTIDVDAP